MTNYRPITVLSNISKIFERIIDNRLNEFFSACNFFHAQQYGFLPQSNTTAATTNFGHNVQSTVDKNGFCAGIFVDVSKAFDCVAVDYGILLHKMNRLGIRRQ
jgi:hypothetical protein